MTRNYKEDQQNELEALDSIYCGDMEILDEAKSKFQIPISTEEYNETKEGLACLLVFQYTDKYPDEPPVIEIDGAENFEDGLEEQLKQKVEETVQENLGMEMIFSLVSTAQEWLNEKYDEIKIAKENEFEKQKLAFEEEERKKFEGTKVTVESFLNWKNKFEKDMGITQRKEQELAAVKKLTGRELFTSDTTLNDSDIKFLMEAGDSVESVKIDESLFQNIDDLELGSDEDEDPDWKPGNDNSD